MTDTIPGLRCPRCGGDMRFGNRQMTVVECVNDPKRHRNHVEKTAIEQGAKTAVTIRKSGPAKLYPERVAFLATQEQKATAERLGPDVLRLLLDNADELMVYLCKKSV